MRVGMAPSATLQTNDHILIAVERGELPEARGQLAGAAHFLAAFPGARRFERTTRTTGERRIAPVGATFFTQRACYLQRNRQPRFAHSISMLRHYGRWFSRLHRTARAHLHAHTHQYTFTHHRVFHQRLFLPATFAEATGSTAASTVNLRAS